MGSEPSGPYRVETFTMDDMEYASVVGPNGFSESWATAADRAHEAARLMNIACASGDAAGYERGVREGEARAKLNALCAIRADAVREREGIRNCGNRITEAMAGGAWDSLIQTLDCMIHRARGEPQADGKGGG